ncbi:hypothetical protein RRG08_006727 [Elysia crispata]|uniref:Uncharacterized protein n=1 Tax=Elysia crispata TaxID=231223 RepID=A0AAE1CVT8_9GAST|nr:hypothetical protein RRG08_006727 [Elysia crispata]
MRSSLQIQALHPRAYATGRSSKEPKPKSKHQASRGPPSSSTHKKCGYRGKTPQHRRDKCPARNATCHKCNKKGHYSSVCRTGAVKEIIENDLSDDQTDDFPGTVESKSSSPWTSVLPIDGREERFKLDTGTAVSVVGNGHTHGRLVARFHTLSKVPDFKGEFPELFKSLGKLADPYTIRLRPDVEPKCICTARRIAHPLLPKVKAEIDRMITEGVISPVEQPTDWCSGIVVVPKPNNTVQICVDLTALNHAVLREVHPLRSVDENLAKLSGSKIFTKLDANSGFWQMPLDPESRLLTTFLTPFGRFCMNRLPFGISSAPEIFQRRMSKILHDMEGVICHMDDILIHATTQKIHDERVRAVLQRLRESGLTLNEKCEFSSSSMTFLGHVIDEKGIRADPSKVEGIVNFPEPSNVTELQRFLGMINQLSKFTPELASLSEPLRQLLKKNTVWIWGDPQQKFFETIKSRLCSTPALERTTIIAADASNAGLGAVFIHVQPDGSQRPVSFISRSLTDAEKNYAVIEKEALAATWASERFSEYIFGTTYMIETDHKPLVSLLATKELHKLPPRIQRFRLRLMRYNPEVVHVPGKQQVTADALSRAPASEPTESDIAFVDDTLLMVRQAIVNLPASSTKLQDIACQKTDPELKEVRNYCSLGWPAFMPQNPLLQLYWDNQRHLAMIDDLLLYNDRIVIRREMRLEMLDKLHESHLGITKCRALAQTSIWWPNITSQIEEMVKKWSICAKLRPPTREPLLASSFPDQPRSRVAMDLFELKGKTFLLVVDYHSRWPEIRILDHLTSSAVITRLKSIFATHGIPDIVISDNGPQFASTEFQKFTKEYGFTHTTSSPRYPNRMEKQSVRCKPSRIS